jgi:hypothetical protein
MLQFSSSCEMQGLASEVFSIAEYGTIMRNARCKTLSPNTFWNNFKDDPFKLKILSDIL